ncbi:lipase family protein [Maricurvus nonylphenolicus]|uniref:lipase family protein n=1 Tax=Maricurvus nonylphenolicus TaxID=1008307 RepID=UPI0036F40643
MNSLSPVYAAELAADIYNIKSELTVNDFLEVHADSFEVNQDDKIKGTTGALGILKSTHNMGVAAFGKEDKYKGQAFVIIKGTASLFDGLTDLNAGLKRFETGGLVHQGFYYTFQSFLPQLRAFASELATKNIHYVHCVGHSLGGALATLVSDWLKANTSVKVSLYTFGSPRVGMPLFSDACCRRVGNENVYRVFHNLDPVPMVPTWPFSHVTDSRGDYRMACAAAQNPIKYHSIATYQKNVTNKSSDDWKVLKSFNEPEILESALVSWLESEGPVALTLNSAKLMSAAILWVMNKVSEIFFVGVVVSGSTAFTLLDRLAYLMHKAYSFGKKAGYWVVCLLKRMAKMLGIIVTETTNFTYAFIRLMFIRMHHMVSELTKRAGQSLH